MRVDQAVPFLKNCVPELVAGVLLSVPFSVSDEYLDTGGISLESVLSWRTALMFIGCFGALVVLRLMVGRQPFFAAGERTRRFRSKACVALSWVFSEKHPRRAVLCGAILFVVCWLPYCVALSPGSMNYDTTGQIVQFFSLLENGDYPLNDHHPVFDTVVFGAFFWLGDAFVGDMRAGLHVLIILQAVITAVAISWSMVRAVVFWRVPRSLAAALCLLAGLLPLFPFAVCSLSKDTFFSWLYVLFFTMVVDLAVRGRRLLRKPSFFLGLVAVCVLMGLTKKFGIYVVAGTLAVSVLSAPKTRSNVLRLSAPAAAAVLAVFLAMPQVVSVLGGIPGGKQEALSVPMQQTALSYIWHADSMTEEEINAIDALLECDTLAERYDPIIADPVKGVAKSKDTEAYWNYLKVWAEQGLRFPRTYFDAWAALDAGLFSGRPCEFVTDSLEHVDGMGYVSESTFEKPSGNQAASDFVSAAYMSLAQAPVAGRIIALSTYAVLIPLFCLLSIMRSRCRQALLPVAASIVCTLAGVVLSPVTVGIEATRYIMPLVYSMPASWRSLAMRCSLVRGRQSPPGLCRRLRPENKAPLQCPLGWPCADCTRALFGQTRLPARTRTVLARWARTCERKPCPRT